MQGGVFLLAGLRRGGPPHNTQLLTASVPPSWEQRTPVKPGQLQPLRRSIMRWDQASVS